MSPMASLYAVALDILRLALVTTLRFEGWIVRAKLDLIDKLHGEQSRYGW